MTLLYHGTTMENGLSILKTGFDFNKSNTNWGNTYGKGIYFTPNYETAKFYAGENGIVISLNINTIEYHLNKMVSPSTRKKLKISKDKNYNCIVTLDKDEYLITHFI